MVIQVPILTNITHNFLTAPVIKAFILIPNWEGEGDLAEAKETNIKST